MRVFNAPRTARLPFVSEPYEVNDKEFASVSGLEGRQRFEHLLKRICDTETVFLLIDDDGGLVVLTDEENAAPPQVPVWPHPRYAEAYRASFGGGAGYGPMELGEFVDDVLPHLAQEGANLVAMPTEQQPAVAIAADELRKAIISYHEEWYGGWPK
jgi:uncharacterized protein DUF2750